MLPPPSGLVTLLTDLGTRGPDVGWMKGRIKCEHRRAELVDLCHEVADVAAGRVILEAAVGRFPPGTIHVAFVAATAGEQLLAAVAHGCYWIAPDNGLLGFLGESATEVRELRPAGMDVDVAEFAGAEVLALVAGKIGAGRYGFRSVGPKVETTKGG